MMTMLSVGARLLISMMIRTDRLCQSVKWCWGRKAGLRFLGLWNL